MSGNESLNIDGQYEAEPSLYGIWVRQNNHLKLSVQGTKAESRNDPVIVYCGTDGTEYTFIFYEKASLMEHQRAEKT
tara:strand:- start:988 stop:1218 length:231 start_codon:yes stop_codon:yes gene_type:complete